MTYGQRKGVAKLVEKIAAESGMDEADIWHIVQVELERMYDTRLGRYAKDLTLRSDNLRSLVAKQAELREAIQRKNDLIRRASEDVAKSSAVLEDRSNMLAAKREELEVLNSKLDAARAALSVAENEGRKAEYGIMMARHSTKAKTDMSFKVLVWFLSVATVVGVIIAILFGMGKHK